MKRRKTALIGAVIVILCILSSCDSLPGFLSGEERGFVALEFSLIGENILDVSSVRIDLSSNDSSRNFSEAFDLNESSLSAYGFIPEVPTGNWSVDIRVYNSAGGMIVEDNPGDEMQVLAGEVCTITVTYDPAAGSDLTIGHSSSSTVQSAVSLDSSNIDGCFILHTSGDNGFIIDEFNYLSGTGEFQAASSFSFEYPDGSSVGFSSRSIYADVDFRFDDSSFFCARNGGGYGTCTVRVTDIHGVAASADWSLPYGDVYNALAYSTNPPQSGSITASGDNVITWNPVNDSLVESIVVVFVEKASMGSVTPPPPYVSPSAHSGTEVSFTLPGSTLTSFVEYVMIIMTFDEWISDTSPFGTITNFYPDALIETLLSYPGYNFDCIGLSYTTFGTTS